MSGIEMANLNLSAPDLTPSAAQLAAKASSAKDVQATVKAAKDFESILLHKVFEEMQHTVPKSGLLDDSATEQVQGIFWMNLAQDVAAKGGVGLWKQVYRQMQRTADAAATTLEVKK